ncbi:MAG: cbb3-type cytochrome c oxidase subunit 3 [Dokdonella sp.]
MLSGIITLILLVVFVGGWFWAWSPRRKADFDAAARLPLDDSDMEDRP